jgi:hypothetical protein
MTDRSRVWVLVAVGVICVAGAAGYVRFAARRSAGASEPAAADFKVEWIEGRVQTPPYLLFRSTLPGKGFGRVAYVPLDAVDGPRYLTPISCDRLYFRAGRGICLTVEDDRLFPNYAYVFDARFHLGRRTRLTGPPSRTRVSPDGRLAAITVFEEGHSYAQAGFSTRTSFVDTRTEQIITDLERFDVQRDGRRIKAVDFNFWGVTFMPDSRHFYATLGTAGQMYLIRGDVDRRAAEVVRPGVECPSLSPDGTRIAFKKRTASRGWQVAVLDLATAHETVLDAEPRSVDDQVDWLDNQHVLYHQSSRHGADIWVLRTDNAEAPQILVAGAYSPAVVRE